MKTFNLIISSIFVVIIGFSTLANCQNFYYMSLIEEGNRYHKPNLSNNFDNAYSSTNVLSFSHLLTYMLLVLTILLQFLHNQ